MKTVQVVLPDQFCFPYFFVFQISVSFYSPFKSEIKKSRMYSGKGRVLSVSGRHGFPAVIRTFFFNFRSLPIYTDISRKLPKCIIIIIMTLSLFLVYLLNFIQTYVYINSCLLFAVCNLLGTYMYIFITMWNV